MGPIAKSLINSSALVGLMLVGLTFTTVCVSAAQKGDPYNLFRIDSEESDAIISILAKKKANRSILEEDWKRLFSSDGYKLLKKRAELFRRDFNDDKFKGFVLSDSLFGQLQGLTTSLEKLKTIDVQGSMRRALAYLPESTQIRTRIYFLIKPTINSFVFYDTNGNPAIVLNVSSNVSIDKFKNKIVHELFHIGYNRSFEAMLKKRFADGTHSRTLMPVFEKIGYLNEGYAMLAAAGGPDIHPHEASTPEERARWDNDMKNFNVDLRRIDRYFTDMLQARLTDEEIDQTDSSFFGYQGPWYTVGWKVAITIERAYGRARLIQCLTEPGMLFSTYNEAASTLNRSRTDSVALWSHTLIQRIAK